MNEIARILVIDDESEIRDSLEEVLVDEGYSVLQAGTIDEAMSAMEKAPDLALIDIKLGDENGIDLLKSLKDSHPHMPIIMITGHGSIALATHAFKLGAHDFLEKPLRLLQIRTCVRNALENVGLRRKLTERSENGPSPIFTSSCMKELYHQVHKLAQIRESVVVYGPSGSGKELIARALHSKGPRAKAPFIATNAASLPVSLAEDELFGHEKGAFTGAESQRQGCIERAHGGTLFLDEIADMDLQIQAKLLRVLENGIYQRVGGNQPLQAGIRLVCATHKNIDELVSQGIFRHDLWYRISAFIVRVPGLEERNEDIPLLANYFLESICAELGSVKTFDPTTLKALQHCSYPGNVRELKHIVTRLAVFCPTECITKEWIDRTTIATSPAQTPSEPTKNDIIEITDFRTARRTFETRFFQTALEKAGGSITAAAHMIKMAQPNLSRKLKELGIR